MMVKFVTLLIALLCIDQAFAKEYTYDVVVYGATASGVMAGIAAVTEGRTVAIVEPGVYVGGMVTGGLSASDKGNTAVIGGLAAKFFKDVGTAYKSQSPVYNFEPHVAQEVFKAYIEKYSNFMPVFFNNRVVNASKEGTTAKGIYTNATNVFYAKVFIDASYEGDLLPLLKVSYTWGREGVSKYNESLAGRQPGGFSLNINPYDDNGNLIPLIYGGPQTKPYEGDHKVMAYNYRLCATNVTANRLDFPTPSHYDPARWEVFRRYLKNITTTPILDSLVSLGHLPNGKYDINNRDPMSTDFIGASWEYVEANWTRKLEIWESHKQYTLEYFHFLQNDESVPASLKAEARSFGLCKDEFVSTGGFPNQLYVREARRMVGQYVMTQWDRLQNLRKKTVIGMGSYQIDSHMYQRIPVDNNVKNEGGMGHKSPDLFDIPYESLVPKIEECTNLIVPVCMSASHIGYCPIRLEPQYMIMGQSSGVAASHAIVGQTPVQKIDIEKLQARLKELGQVLHV